jgi:hypothetical protein
MGLWVGEEVVADLACKPRYRREEVGERQIAECRARGAALEHDRTRVHT